ncbi:MAG: endonuclease III [Candidatus Marinimicrobia bacterium]|nr:endonuclease III [Candidatus Neomarinimicrobiota bacterium]MDP6853236.1 endonuclease III [Candidatus Neomarinimicrobiota bacterium]
MKEVLRRLKAEYPDSKCSLQYNSPLQLLVATILSAQCTDARVNKVTEKLFRKYPEPKDFAEVSLEQLKSEIYSTGFYNNKAKSIKSMAETVLKKWNGILPDTLDEMVKLPGVGRKTANVVMGNVFHVPSLVVDTHVTRIANLLGFVKTKDAVRIEKALIKIVEKKDWTLFAHLLIDHGRAVCIANRPKCDKCIIAEYCPSNFGG